MLDFIATYYQLLHDHNNNVINYSVNGCCKLLIAQDSWLLGGVIMTEAVGQLPTENLFEICVAFRISSWPSHARTLALRSETPTPIASRAQLANASDVGPESL